MNYRDFKTVKAKIRKHKEKSTDMDILVDAIMKLPFGQVKKVLSEEVLAVLAKYGYTECCDGTMTSAE